MNLKPVIGSLIVTLAVLLTVTQAGCASTPALSGKVTLDGSLNVEPVARKLASDFTAMNPKVDIIITGSSTADGIKAVDTGRVDIGGASRDLKPDEPKLVTRLFARDGIAIIVHPSNPVKGLSKTQIRDIFAGRITNWKEVGGKDQPVIVVTREEATSTRTVVEEMLMGGDKITSIAIVQLVNEDQKASVMRDPQAIGYNPFAASLDGTVKALAVEGVEATKDNAKNGTYPLVRPLYFLTKGDPAGLVKAYIDYCLGEEGQKLVTNLGYVPVR